MRAFPQQGIKSGWNRRRLGHLIQFRNGKDTKSVEAADGAYPVYGSGGEFKRADAYLYDGPSILFGRKGTLDKPLLVHGKFWTVDTMLYTIPGPEVDPKFVHYWALTVPYQVLSTDTAVPSMTSTDLGQLYIHLPKLETQRAIADYLDRETAEIDAMTADLDELEKLLTEHRNSIATIFIGNLESDPDTRRVSLNVVADLISSSVDKKSREGEPLVRLVNYTDVYYGDTLTADADYMEATATPEQIERVGVRDGDVIFTKDSETADDIGIPALIRNPDPDMVCGYHLTIARPRRELINPRYLYWILMSGQAKSYWTQAANGVTRFSIGSSATSRLPVVLPPLNRQEKVAAEIDRETAEIDAMLADITELRDLLAERRAALIAAAVTGQIDIPTAEEPTHA
ncbi:restriction endonuclease subunit S [Corynebacterium urealyticum]|uniref:restriction endonuclease subunit S n=1 Tax=Corynebacterium urealyticum TaxID=43771 RepID=UPI00293EF8EF|nr:restriction endonuclease subunit S [Corynebacterium urealyticum]WOH93582.1 restriction endonuclease subunit S [Corynebacterium urealyticum]